MNQFNLAYLLLTEPRWTGRNDHDITTDKGFNQPLTNAKYRQMYVKSSHYDASQCVRGTARERVTCTTQKVQAVVRQARSRMLTACVAMLCCAVLCHHRYAGTLMAAGGFTPETAAEALRQGHYDLIGFGRWYISNPDLVERIRTGAPLNVCVYQR